MAHVITQIPELELDEFFKACSTIGAYVVFPSKRIDRKVTINGARGFNSKIKDRFDLTLECIRRHYLKQQSPLSDVLERYASFFDLFRDFQGYVDFFHFEDLISRKYDEVNFFLPFDDFASSPLPANSQAYWQYRDNLIAFVSARNDRIAQRQTR